MDPQEVKGIDVQKAKVALVEAGIIKTAGRGRISADGHAWLKQQYDAGMRFSDWPKGEITVTKTEASAGKPAETTVKVTREAGPSNAVVEPLITYPESQYEAYEFVDGKKKAVGMRECCNTCRVSLVGHVCEEPTILGNRRVYITPKR